MGCSERRFISGLNGLIVTADPAPPTLEEEDRRWPRMIARWSIAWWSATDT